MKTIEEKAREYGLKLMEKYSLSIADTPALEDAFEAGYEEAQQPNASVCHALERWILNHSEDEQNEPYLITTTGETYSLKDILKEIRQQTEFGRKMEQNIIMLAVDLLTRGKRVIND